MSFSRVKLQAVHLVFFPNNIYFTKIICSDSVYFPQRTTDFIVTTKRGNWLRWPTNGNHNCGVNVNTIFGIRIKILKFLFPFHVCGIFHFIKLLDRFLILCSLMSVHTRQSTRFICAMQQLHILRIFIVFTCNIIIVSYIVKDATILLRNFNVNSISQSENVKSMITRFYWF